MRKTACLILIFLTISGTLFAQEQYPKHFQAGTKIEIIPDVNVYLISESQFDNSLKINELYKSSEQRIKLLQLKIAHQDSIINLLRTKEANFDSTIARTKQNLDLCTNESESYKKELAKEKDIKKKLIGLAGLEAIIILILAL